MQEWYLMTSNTRPNLIGGFENEAYLNYKEDGFTEVLETDIATTVTLFNYDLSQSQTIRCVIQNNVADTQLKSMERQGLFQISTVKAGMYIFFENRYWLITGYPGNNGVYEKAALSLCQYLLRWQNSQGNIIERWINGTSASKYDVGESENKVLTISTNTFTIVMPDDDECMELDGKRVFIDKKKVNPTKIYKITRNDDILYDYGSDHGGVISFIADKVSFNKDTDNQELRICDYFSPTISQPTLNPNETTISTISGNANLKIGYTRTYTVSFTDENGNELSGVNFSWNVVSSFADKINQTVSGNTIKLQVDDYDYIDSSFLLEIYVDGNLNSQFEINIVSAY